jgi:ribosome biogenesis GTPase / thiamine phosphate phosphatase
MHAQIIAHPGPVMHPGSGCPPWVAPPPRAVRRHPATVRTVPDVVSPAPDDPTLAPFGWDAGVRHRWLAAVAGADPTRVDGQPMVPGRVIRTSRRFTYVATVDGLVQALAPHELEPAPVAGDWVAVWDGGEERGARVEAVAARTTELARRDPAGGSDGQVLAANVDLVLAVFGLDRPVRPGRVERSLVLAHDSGAVPVVVLTKVDAVDDADAQAAGVRALTGDVDVILVSSVTGDGTSELAQRLAPHRTAVLVGESGAGKSTLVNRLAGRDVQRTAEVRTADAKGRHTTVTRDLIVLDGGGVVIDTPGLRALGLLDSGGGVAATFDDISGLADQCRFRDCAHGDEPGCAVTAAVAAGTLDPERLARYHGVLTELAEADQAVTEAARKPRGRPSPPPTS